MNPRRLIPYVVIFLLLVGGYVVLLWHQGQKTAQEEQAKQLYAVQEGQVEGLTLIKGQGEIQLAKQDKEWYLTKPVNTKADQAVVDSMLVTLAHLKKERNLGVEKNRQAFGLEQPALVVQFTAGGQTRRLAIGHKVPGGRGYYAQEGKGAEVVIISAGAKDSLDREVFALRDKVLLPFITAEVTGLTIKTGRTEVELQKTADHTWNWEGRPEVKVRGDRVEKLLRTLDMARVKEFPATPPKSAQAAGLIPRRQMEVTVVTKTGARTLFLGATRDDAVYARRGEAGPVVLVDAALPEEIKKAVASLEDRRLWSGPIPEVAKIIYSPPDKSWTLVKDKDTWQITGPEKQEIKQNSVRVELVLWNFQKLEFEKILPPSNVRRSKATPVLQLFDGAGKEMLQVAELGQSRRDQVLIRTRVGEKTLTGLVARKDFAAWQEEMERLTVATPPPPGAAKPGSTE